MAQQSSLGRKVVREVAGYELLTRLGEGGSGTVFKARQPGLDRFVALKILSPKLANQTEYLRRFQNEAKAAGSVNHPNIVQVLAAGYDSEIKVPYIVYEFVDGVTLTKLVEDRGALPEREALAVARAIAEALGKLDEQGLIHRDLKPDNILVTRGGIPKLTDLGLAKQESDWDTLTATGIVMGTPDYMAPEQATGRRDLDLSTDIYALGITLYVMLTARLPYRGATLVEILTQHLQKDCPDPRAISAWVTEPTARLVAEMTRRDRTQRYRDAGTLVRDITLANAGRPILGPKVPFNAPQPSNAALSAVSGIANGPARTPPKPAQARPPAPAQPGTPPKRRQRGARRRKTSTASSRPRGTGKARRPTAQAPLAPISAEANPMPYVFYFLGGLIFGFFGQFLMRSVSS